MTLHFFGLKVTKQHLKSIVTSTTALCYYDPHLPVTLQGMTTVSADLFQLMAAITSSWLTITVTL